MQHKIQFVSDMRKVSCYLRFALTTKADRHDIAEILLSGIFWGMSYVRRLDVEPQL
jgi:hypothetical protein